MLNVSLLLNVFLAVLGGLEVANVVRSLSSDVTAGSGVLKLSLWASLPDLGTLHVGISYCLANLQVTGVGPGITTSDLNLRSVEVTCWIIDGELCSLKLVS